MAMTQTNNYSGDVANFIYKVFYETQNAVAQGVAQLRTDIRYKEFLPLLNVSEFPAGAYEKTPTGETNTTVYSERFVEPAANMVYETFSPKDWQKMWDKWSAIGSLTELRLNPPFLAEVVAKVKDANIRQNDFLFWQGSAAHANPKLQSVEGIVTRALVDANVTDVVTQGLITEANVFSVIKSTYKTAPVWVRQHPNFVMCMNADDFDTLQDKNIDVKSGTVGILDENIKRMYKNSKILAFEGIPAGHIVATIASNGEDSNLVSSYYFNLEDEITDIIVDKVAANSKEHFMRYDYMLDANYKDPSVLILYAPA
jgi:hypothetical protein